jgi:hypothetical protein
MMVGRIHCPVPHAYLRQEVKANFAHAYTCTHMHMHTHMHRHTHASAHI